MGKAAVAIVLTGEERGELETLVRRRGTAQGLARRAQIVLMAADGVENKEIAARLGRTERAVRYWLQPEAPDTRRIDYVEWLAFKALCEEASGK